MPRKQRDKREEVKLRRPGGGSGQIGRQCPSAPAPWFCARSLSGFVAYFPAALVFNAVGFCSGEAVLTSCGGRDVVRAAGMRLCVSTGCGAGLRYRKAYRELAGPFTFTPIEEIRFTLV